MERRPAFSRTSRGLGFTVSEDRGILRVPFFGLSLSQWLSDPQGVEEMQALLGKACGAPSTYLVSHIIWTVVHTWKAYKGSHGGEEKAAGVTK